jgi:hypothetical protein
VMSVVQHVAGDMHMSRYSKMSERAQLHSHEDLEVSLRLHCPPHDAVRHVQLTALCDHRSWLGSAQHRSPQSHRVTEPLSHADSRMIV